MANNNTVLRSIYRSHTCQELRKEHIGTEVTLSGWIHRKRDHGGVIFVDLRDNYGLTQVVFAGSLISEIEKLRVESAITVHGKVLLRGEDQINDKLETGFIEVHADKLSVLGDCDVLPFLISEDDNAPESTRLKFRFLELRRERLHQNILLRAQIIRDFREVMHSLGFIEFQTPILTSSSPEGARDFLVPSRFYPGKFFALPQAPQQFKQLLMVSGFDRYFQIAPCFRDEDPRADRSPGEFYQCDFEMSFVEQDDVLSVAETLLYQVFSRNTASTVTPSPFPRIPFREAMSKYGTDKPDLRNPLQIVDISSIFKESQFKVFQRILNSGGHVFGIAVPTDKIPPRKYFDDTVEYFQKLSGGGLVYMSKDQSGWKGSIGKFVSQEEEHSMSSLVGQNSQAVVLFIAAGSSSEILPSLGKLRSKLGDDFNLLEKDAFKFCFITDFPMYERDEKTGEIVFGHNPFSMPQGGYDALVSRNPLDILAYQYDVVCNGYEISSGAVRNHEPETMYKAFEIAGYDRSVVDSKFGAMVSAFHYGAPPHAGMAPGIDRIVMLIAGVDAIRDVIAFPLAQSVEDLMMEAPGEVSKKQLKELHIKVVYPDKN